MSAAALVALGVVVLLIGLYRALISRAGKPRHPGEFGLYRAVKIALLVAVVAALILASCAMR